MCDSHDLVVFFLNLEKFNHFLSYLPVSQYFLLPFLYYDAWMQDIEETVKTLTHDHPYLDFCPPSTVTHVGRRPVWIQLY